MSIRRERVKKNFTMIANRVLRDRRLKGEEKGLIAWLLSHDPDWKIIIPVVMAEMGWGRDKTYRILKRLSAFGYIQRTQERNPDSGAFEEVSYTVFSNPDDNPEYTAAAVEQPLPDSPLTENSKASKERKIDSQETPPTPSFNSEHAIEAVNEQLVQSDFKQPVPTFEHFWQAYSPDRYMSRSRTERQWGRMNPVDRQKASNAVAAYLDDCKTNHRKRVNVVRFLRDRVWQGFAPIENIATMTTADPGSPEWIAWREHLVKTAPLRVPFFDTRGREGKSYTVPTKWPPRAS